MRSFNTAEVTSCPASDLDDNGLINITDATILINRLLNFSKKTQPREDKDNR